MSLTVIGTLENLPAAQLDTRIMALCDRAAMRLQEATTLDELETIRAEMQALRVYAEKMKAVDAAINQCWELVTLAEARIGAELAKAQERARWRCGETRPAPTSMEEMSGLRTIPLHPSPRSASPASAPPR